MFWQTPMEEWGHWDSFSVSTCPWGYAMLIYSSTQMDVMDWAEAQCEDPEIKATMDWCHLDKKKSEPWTEQLAKLKSRLGTKKNTPEGRSILWNADKLTLSGGMSYYRYKPKYQIEEVKCFVVPRVHRRTVIDGCHHDAGHQGKKRTESLISD